MLFNTLETLSYIPGNETKPKIAEEPIQQAHSTTANPPNNNHVEATNGILLRPKEEPVKRKSESVSHTTSVMILCTM
jgi:hypothetical protein